MDRNDSDCRFMDSYNLMTLLVNQTESDMNRYKITVRIEKEEQENMISNNL